MRPLFVGKGDDTPRDLPFVERNAVIALVYNPATKKYLVLQWLQHVDWQAFVTGGIEKGQTAEEAARAEVRKETGYTNLRLATEMEGYDAKFYHSLTRENRFAHVRVFRFELVDETRVPIDARESAKHTPVWLSRDALEQLNLPEGHQWLRSFIQ
jgi:8-oxo-dGTP pyrophosphatase MutT (NUDIX family)